MLLLTVYTSQFKITTSKLRVAKQIEQEPESIWRGEGGGQKIQLNLYENIKMWINLRPTAIVANLNKSHNSSGTDSTKNATKIRPNKYNDQTVKTKQYKGMVT